MPFSPPRTGTELPATKVRPGVRIGAKKLSLVRPRLGPKIYGTSNLCWIEVGRLSVCNLYACLQHDAVQNLRQRIKGAKVIFGTDKSSNKLL